MPTHAFTLVLLAGERAGTDPLATYHEVASKVLVPVAGEPIIERVMDTLEGCAFRERIIVGPRQQTLDAEPRLGARLAAQNWRWLAPAGSPAASVVAALDAAPNDAPVLVTTADHGLLSADLVDEFCAQATAIGGDLGIGFARYADVVAAYPDSPRTGWKFADGRYCSCNLFAFNRPASRAVADLWREVESQRKTPWRVVRLLGAGVLVRFLSRRLTLNDALLELGRRSSAEIAPIFLNDPSAAVDVDSIADWQLVNQLLEQRQPERGE